MKIEPGVYEVLRDTKNPKPDRRCRDDWRAVPVWKKGLRFVVERSRYGSHEVLAAHTGRWTHQSIAVGSERFDALVAAGIRRIEARTLGALAGEAKALGLRPSADRTLAVLVLMGAVSPEQAWRAMLIAEGLLDPDGPREDIYDRAGRELGRGTGVALS